MLHIEGKKAVDLCDGLTRRDFLRIGALGAGSIGLSLAELGSVRGAEIRDVNCILLFLVGGPSQLDTWDPKSDAPDRIRGPFRPIRTNVPGIQLAETFPLMAGIADRYALVRSLYHEAAPIHETGHQLVQTGRLSGGGVEHPHYGSVLSALRGPRQPDTPPFVVLPTPVGDTGVSVNHAQGAGYLGPTHEPIVLRGDPARPGLIAAADAAHRACEGTRAPADAATTAAYDRIFSGRAKQALDLATESDNLRDRYGRHTFGQSCLVARRLVEAGVRLVTVNMFETVFDNLTWDCHADGGSLATTLADYRQTLCPMFDSAYTALLEDLHQRGMLPNTLVLAMGEFGRTPELNSRGGRDHWPGCWTVLFAGGGVRGGQIVGASDATAAEPHDRPVTPAELAATVYRSLGLDPATRLSGPDGRPLALADASAVEELFRG
jgi:uncharacterized protein (DUF1501 family)